MGGGRILSSNYLIGRTGDELDLKDALNCNKVFVIVVDPHKIGIIPNTKNILLSICSY